MVNVQGRVIEEVFSNRYEEQEGSMSVAEYAAKFDELSRFCPYINVEGAEESKCVKFERDLRPEIYQYVCFHEICDLYTLVNTCRLRQVPTRR